MVNAESGVDYILDVFCVAANSAGKLQLTPPRCFSICRAVQLTSHV